MIDQQMRNKSSSTTTSYWCGFPNERNTEQLYRLNFSFEKQDFYFFEYNYYYNNSLNSVKNFIAKSM